MVKQHPDVCDAARLAGGQEQEQRRRTQGTSSSSSSSTVFAASDAVLHQRTYFTPVMFAYVFGLAFAFAANEITHLGQPALLYIVPATLGAVLLTATARGELDKIWNFMDTSSADAKHTKEL